MDGATPRPGAGQSDRDATRCVVLAPPEVNLDEALRARLREHGWRTMTVHDPHIALAELCLQERLQASRSAWGLQRAEQLALVLALGGSEAAERVSMLVNAVRRYVPAASIWKYEDGALRLIDAGIRPESPANTGEPADPALIPFSTGSIASTHDASSRETRSAASSPDGPDDDDSARVTADELAMLLARDQEGGPRS
jgi:hypothetical protein